MIGKKILSYEIIELLGEGGMGNVYLAEHIITKEKAAIKSLLPQLIKHESIRERFKMEADTLSRLRHENIVKLIGYKEDGDSAYIIMEYVEGKDLSRYIKQESGPMPSERALPLMTQILNAFSFAHTHAVIHRDIKPSNILLTKDDQIKIIDFGIAKVLTEADRKLTKTGLQMGAVYYMSPEQVKGKTVDKRSDIYSLGVTFFQMVTGQSPYESLTTEYEVYQKIVQEPLPSAKSIYPSAHSMFDKVIAKATAKDPEQRYADCGQFLAALNGIVKVKEKKVPKKNWLKWGVPAAIVVAVIAFAIIQYNIRGNYKDLIDKAFYHYSIGSYDAAINFYTQAAEKRKSILLGKGEEDLPALITDCNFQKFKIRGGEELKTDKFSLSGSTDITLPALASYLQAKTYKDKDEFVNQHITLCENIKEGMKVYSEGYYDQARALYQTAINYARQINTDPMVIRHLEDVLTQLSPPTAEFISMRGVSNTYQEDLYCLSVDLEFKTRFLQGKKCVLLMTFFDEYGNKWKDFHHDFTPEMEDEKFEKNFFFEYYQELKFVDSGTYLFIAELTYDGKSLARSKTMSYNIRLESE